MGTETMRAPSGLYFLAPHCSTIGSNIVDYIGRLIFIETVAELSSLHEVERFFDPQIDRRDKNEVGCSENAFELLFGL